MPKHRAKGQLGDANLPISKKYALPVSRNPLLWLGLAAALVALAYAAYNFEFGHGAFLASGPLSSAHANLQSDCASCHVAFETVTDANCQVCHEKLGDELGVYSYASHYLYRSGDFQRVKPHEGEMPCASCHPEHRGRDGRLTVVADSQCLGCHPFGSFNDAHPQFAALSQPDAGSLKFPHVHHVREVMKREELQDMETACLYCHNPREDGKTFQPMDFDRHCDACHLTTSTGTPRLAIAKPDQPGALTLADIQRRNEPGSLWAFYTNPNEFRELGGRFVSKSPVHHRDPWVMENLRQFRKMVYPDAGLADLLAASPEAPPHEARTLYREAIETLRGYALELRSRPEPEIQQELARIEDVLDKAERRLADDPYLPLDVTEFPLSLLAVNPDLDPERAAEIRSLANDLTEPCRVCHELENLTIARVQADQRTLRRAEFNHRAHILQRRCLDCHHEIPIRELTAGQERVSADLDRAEIQNLPGIEDCRQCHNETLASNQCVSCHQFHPDKSKRSHLLLYLD